MTSSYFSNPREVVEKLQQSEVDPDRLRDYIFRTSRDAGDLDDELERLYDRGAINAYGDEDYEEAVSGRDLRNEVDVSDFAGEIPYQGYRIDPDYENYSPFRLATENPKVAQYLQNQPFQLDAPIEQNRQALYDAFRRGDITTNELNYLNQAGGSDFLEGEDFDEDSANVVGELIRDVTGRDLPYEENIPRVGDALSIIDDITNPVFTAANLYQRGRDIAQMRNLTSPFNERVVSRIPGGSTANQLGLPLTQLNPEIERLISSAELPERFEDFRSDVSDLTRLIQGPSRSNPYLTDPETNIARQVLPNVEALFGSPSQVSRAVARERQNRETEAAQRNELYSITRDLNDLEAEQRLMSRSLSRRPSEINTVISEEPGSGTPGIPGLSAELRKSKEKAVETEAARDLENIRAFVEKYPEVGPFLQSPISSKQPAIERDISKLQNYVDTSQQISKPEDRLNLFKKMSSELGVPYQAIRELEKDYTSGDPVKQKGVRDYIERLGYGEDLASISSPALSTRLPVVGGGGYETNTEETKRLAGYINKRAEDFNTLARSLGPEAARLLEVGKGGSGERTERYSFNPETNEAYIDPEGEYGVKLSRGYLNPTLQIENPLRGFTGDVSLNTLKFLADNPVTGSRSVSFSTKTPEYSDYSYESKDIPRPVFDLIESFVKRNALADLKPGTIVVNSPLGTTDIAQRLEEEGVSPKESSILRREESFIGAKPNRRGAAYRAGGFGPLTRSGEQFAYVNAEGNIVPLQPGRPAPSLAGRVSVEPSSVRGTFVSPQDISVLQSREPLTSKAYFSVDPVTAATRGAGEFARGIRRVPASLLPGAADLIPSPAAIQTGYSQGPLAMGAQMGREFVQSLPQAAAASAVLATPAMAPLAPGIGAGLVGKAATEALNEVVRQETGEGIVPKLRQAIGTQQRTNIASPPRVGEKPLVAQLRPLSTTQRQEIARQQNRNEVQRRLDLARERFNPRRGEFGISELLFGR